MDKREREVRRLVKKLGFKMRNTRKGHFAIVDGMGTVVAVTGSSPGRNALTHLESDLRRAMKQTRS